MYTVADILIAWYERNGRSLPWRETRDPYRIWLSEVILQQTRVAQGMDYYLRFTERFPNVASLAAADEDSVLKLWQGLGYYSRARNLHAAARQVMEQFGGDFPEKFEDVRSLRGVGDYTAAAICSMAYDLPCAVVDGNVYRVLGRLFDIEEPIATGAGKKLYAALARETLGEAPPAALPEQKAERLVYNLIMDDYNKTCADLPKIRAISDARKRSVRALLNELENLKFFPGFTPYEKLHQIFTMAQESDFLSGRNKKWDGCSFDWLMNKSNALKVLEGNYKNKGGFDGRDTRISQPGYNGPDAAEVGNTTSDALERFRRNNGGSGL